LERLAEEERLRREEEERARRRKEAETEAERLLQMLSKLEEDEAERLRQDSQPVEKEPVSPEKFEHCAFGDMDLMGLSEEELDTQCDELFKTAPIDFVPRQGNQIDISIYELIKS